ncbi:MAG: hypothetical protein NZ551_03845 [Microscillaceae bacterium]|nr:hypothetical protein [Microscillaceae bacterium]MDW8460322.1 hypothetical protein [Cytophagales bacterium]
MDEKLKTEEYQPAEEVSTSELFRELIVGPEKREREAQLQGMKELFTAMLVENKKEYDTQVRDLKSLFVNILEENRRVFQMQLQDLYKSLPQMITTSVKSSQKEEVIFIAETKDTPTKEQIEKYSRLDAVKEIILGKDIQNIEEQISQLHKQIKTQYEEDQQTIFQMAQFISDRISEMEKKVTQELNALCDRISQELGKHNQKQMDRKHAAQILLGKANS